MGNLLYLGDKVLLVLLGLSFKRSLRDLDFDLGSIGLLNNALSKLLVSELWYELQ